MLALRLRLMNHYQMQLYALHVSRGSPEYMRAVAGYVKQFVGALTAVVTFTSESLIALGLITFLMIQSPVSAGLLIFGFAGFSYCYHLAFRKKLTTYAIEANTASKDLVAAVSEGFQGFKEVRIYNAESYFLNKIKSATNVEIKTGMFLILVRQAPRQLLQVGIILAITLFVATAEITEGSRVEMYPLLAMFGFGALRRCGT